MPTQDEEIARHLREALASGELARAEGFGKPLAADDAWDATPEALRMPFKVLKNAGYAPPEVALFHERAALMAALEAVTTEAERVELRGKLSDLQQKARWRFRRTGGTRWSARSVGARWSCSAWTRCRSSGGEDVACRQAISGGRAAAFAMSRSKGRRCAAEDCPTARDAGRRT